MTRTADHSSRATGPAPPVADLVTLHALGWLVVGNLVGLLLASLLLVPEAGDLFGPLTYGRWMPVHWNAQLYGWLALPMVGLLLRVYRAEDATARMARLAVAAWSAALFVGCVSWLVGRTGGKPFLEWTGSARWLLIVTFLVLEGVLAVAFLRNRWRPLAGSVRAVALVGLAAVPVAMWIATSPRVYPPINPDSGGPTGTSLLGSTLGIVWLFVLTPAVLGLRLRPRNRARDRAPRWIFAGAAGTGTATLAGLHTVGFLLLELVQGGDRSHHEALQVLALASLIPWPILLWRHLRRFRFAPGSGPWLAALGGWGTLLVGSAFVTFLPGILERWKFTNALVAHAHLAMAGMVTGFSCLTLLSMAEKTSGSRPIGLGRVLAAPVPFAIWQLGCFAYVTSMMILGALEGIDPGLVIRSAPTSVGLYGLRWIAGAFMLGASVHWLTAARRRLRLPRLASREATGAGAEGAADRTASVTAPLRTADEEAA